MKQHPGNSSEQQGAEKLLIQLLSKKLGVKLTKTRLKLPHGDLVELDGYSESPLILVEVYAHFGSLKPAQQKKVISDAVKLSYTSKELGDRGKKILLFADEDAAKPFRNGRKGWMVGFLRGNEIEVRVIEIPELEQVRIKEAQKRQYR